MPDGVFAMPTGRTREMKAVGESFVTGLLLAMIFVYLVLAAQFESWLFRLARNTCIDQLRRQKLRRIFLPFGEEHENIAEPPGAVGTEELDALRHALEQLRPQDRALLALVQEGRSHAEIAETLDTTVAAVKARLHRAREHLREHYQPDHEN